MSKSSMYKKTAGRLRNELQNRKLVNSSIETVEKTADEGRPPGLRGREIGLWYANRNRMRKELGTDSEQQNDMVCCATIWLRMRIIVLPLSV